MEALLEDDGAGDVPDAEAPLPEPTGSTVNIDLQWRNFTQGLHEGETGEENLERMRQESVSLGYPSLPHHQMAILYEMRRADNYELSNDQVYELLHHAHDLAPHLPYARLELASTRLTGGFDSAHRSILPYVEGVQQGYNWLDTRIGWALKALLLLLMTSGIVFVGFLLAQLLRYFGITAYDGTRVLPRGFSSTQTVILLVALVLVPGLILQSPLVSMLLLLLLVLPFQQINERMIAIGFLGLLAALPWLDDRIGEFVTYPDSDAQNAVHAHYHGCDDECRQWLDTIAEEDRGVARYVERVALFRTGDAEHIEQLAQWFDDHDPASADDGLQPHWLNLEGATKIASGSAEEALDVLREATDIATAMPEPWFNKARAYQIVDDQHRSGEAMQRSFARDLDAVTLQANLDDRDPHSFLMVANPDSTLFWQQLGPSGEDAPSLIAPVWTIVAGDKIDMDSAMWLGLGGILVVLLTTPLYLSRRLSSPCPKCGLARDPTEAQDTGHHHYCRPCYQTFVSGASMDYHARVHSEATLGRRDRLQQFLRRVFSLITPGIGHVLGGHAIRGIIAFSMLVFGIFILFYPLGPVGAWRGSFELFQDHWAGQHVLAWVFISIGVSVGLTGAWRGIRPTRKDGAPPENGGQS